jgi:hypothetical protein
MLAVFTLQIFRIAKASRLIPNRKVLILVMQNLSDDLEVHTVSLPFKTGVPLPNFHYIVIAH